MSISRAPLAGVVRHTMPPSPPPIIRAPEVDRDNCKLMGPFALFVQAIMGIIVIGSLVYKRQGETPKRKWKIWALDVSKQLLGQLFVHILNVVLSVFVASGGGENPCSLYFLNILVDTTLGVFFIYVALNYVTCFLTQRLGLQGFVSGQYTPPLPTLAPASAQHSSSPHSHASPTSFRTPTPMLEYWFKQLASYLFVLLLMKMAVLVIFALFPFLFDVGSWILGFFGNNMAFQVLFSMALFPLAMNVLQFWLIDSLLRHNPDTSAYSTINPGHDAFLNNSDRISQDSRFSESISSADPPLPSHSLHVATHDDAHHHSNNLVQPHASGSPKSRGTPSLHRTSPSSADHPYDYPPPTHLYGSVYKSPPLIPSRPTDEMRRHASLSLSDTTSNQDPDPQTIHHPLPPSSLSLQRSESHHLRQLTTDTNT